MVAYSIDMHLFWRKKHSSSIHIWIVFSIDGNNPVSISKLICLEVLAEAYLEWKNQEKGQ